MTKCPHFDGNDLMNSSEETVADSRGETVQAKGNGDFFNSAKQKWP